MFRLVLAIAAGLLVGLFSATGVVAVKEQDAILAFRADSAAAVDRARADTLRVAVAAYISALRPDSVRWTQLPDTAIQRALNGLQTADSTVVAQAVAERKARLAALAARAATEAAADSARARAAADSAAVLAAVDSATARAAADSVARLASADSAAAAAQGIDQTRLAKLFAAMPVKEAARVLEQMDDAEIQTVLSYLRDRQAAAILGSLPPERAAGISRSVLGGGRSSQ